MIKNKQARNSAIEVCRILSMVMIVGCHFASHGGFYFNKYVITVPKLWWHVIEMGGNFGVDVFILISGYFLVDNTTLRPNIKKILKLWGQIFFYSIIIYTLSIVLNIHQFSVKQLIKSMFPITTDAWWFATAYFVLFLIHPFINRLIYSLDKRQYQSLLILLLLVWCIIPTVTSYNLGSNALWQFVIIYIIGGYIKLYGKTIRLKSHHYFCLWLAATMITYTSSVAFMFLGRTISSFADHTLFFYDRLSLPTLLRAIFFFMCFEKMTVFNCKFINIISSATFGVYLIHDNNIIRPLLWKTLFINAQYQDSLLLVPYSIGITLLVYISCTMIDLLRINTIERVYLKKINNMSGRIIGVTEQFVGRIRRYMFGKEG